MKLLLLFLIVFLEWVFLLNCKKSFDRPSNRHRWLPFEYWRKIICRIKKDEQHFRCSHHFRIKFENGYDYWLFFRISLLNISLSWCLFCVHSIVYKPLAKFIMLYPFQLHVSFPSAVALHSTVHISKKMALFYEYFRVRACMMYAK